MMDACPKLKLAVKAANLAINAANAANTAYSNARHAADQAWAEVTQAEDMAKQYAVRALELGKLAAGMLGDAAKYSIDQGLARTKLQALKLGLAAAKAIESAAYWTYDKVKNAWWFIRDPAWWVYDKTRKARESLERQVQNQQRQYDQSSAMAAAARRAATDLTASAAKAAVSAAYWKGLELARRVKAAALETAAVVAKGAAKVANAAKEAADNLVSSQRVDCQKTLAERQRLESLAEQLAALTGVSVDTWLKPGTFTGPLDKAANLQNLITAIGIWNALKATPEKALNAIKTGLPNLWNSITNAFKNNPLAAWGTAIGTAIMAAIGGHAAYCGLSSTLSLLHLAGMFSLPLAGLLTTDKKQRVYGIFVGMLLSGMVLSACMGGTTTTPIAPPTGEWLCPAAPTSTPTPTQTMTPPPPTVMPLPTYVVQPGDNLFTIAKSTGMCADEIAKASGISDMNAILTVGAVLTLAPCKYGFTPTPPSQQDQPPPIPPSDPGHQQQAMQMFDYMVDLAGYCGKLGSAAITATECPWWAKDGVVTQAEIIELTAYNEFQSTENEDEINAQKDTGNNDVNTTKRGTVYLRIQWENVNVQCAGNIYNDSSECRKSLANFLGDYQIWYQSNASDTLGKFGNEASHNIYDSYFYNRYWDTGSVGDVADSGLDMAKLVQGDVVHYADSTCFLTPSHSQSFDGYNDNFGLVYEHVTYNSGNGVWVLFMTEAQWNQNMQGGQFCPQNR
jgi:hypothetical protein